MSSMLPRSYLVIRRPGSSLLMMVAVDSCPVTTATVCTVSVSAIHPSIPASSRTSQPPGGQLVKDDDAVSGLTCPGLAGLDVFDLDGDTGERVASVAPLLHPQGAVGGIPERQSRSLVILHICVLGAFLWEQVVPGRISSVTV